MTVGATESAGRADSVVNGGSPVAALSLQELITRILDLFSVTSWLPSVLLTGNAVLLTQYGEAGKIDLVDLWRTVTPLPTAGIVTAVLFILIVATLVMQTIELVALRLCAGYWPVWQLQAIGLSHMTWRWSRLRARQAVVAHQIWQELHPELERRNVSPQAVEDLRKWISGEVDAHLAGGALPLAENWKWLVPQHLVVRWEAVFLKLGDYPGHPPYGATLLGTYLRRLTEDLRSYGVTGPLSTPALGHSAPDALRLEFNAARNRLDMHASLTLAFSLLGVIAIFLTVNNPASSRMLGVELSTTYGGLAVMSYFAALRMARNFGHVALAAAECRGT